jgi:hypothetical protein
MLEILYVLGVVESCGRRSAFLNPSLVARLPRVDTFEDAESSEIWERNLQSANGLSSGNVVSCGSPLRLGGITYIC